MAPNLARNIAIGKGATYDAIRSKQNFQIFTNVIFAERKIDTLQLWYVNNKFWRSVMTYPVHADLKVMDEYYNIIKELSMIYGEPKLLTKILTPYQEEDDNVFEIKQGNVDHRAIWYIPGQNSIELQINQDLRFKLTYTNGVLKRAADTQDMYIKSKDY